MTSNDAFLPLLVAFVGSAGFSQLIVWWRDRSTAGAAAADVLADASTKTVLMLEARLERTENDVAFAQGEIAELKRGVRLLSEQLTELGHRPVWPTR